MPSTSGLLQEGRYRIDHSIAENGSSSVFQAYDTVRDSKVIVKEIVVKLGKVTTLSQQENLKLAFANQAERLYAIRHDSLVQVQDYFSEIGRQYLVLESVEGDDLKSLIEQNKRPFPVADVSEWADQLLDALQYLHSLETPIIHRFIRPSNVRLLPNGKVKLLAHASSDGESDLSTSLNEEPNEAAVLNYSPLELIWNGLDSASQKVIVNAYDDRSEKVLKSPADARSDIYALGATLYHLLSGRMPVDPLERSIEMLEGRPDPLKPLHKIDPSVPAEISEVVLRALEIKREARFDSAVIMRQVLRTALVRTKEREADEARELEEAAEELRSVEKTRQDLAQALVEKKARELEEQKARQAEMLEQKARELEAEKLRQAELLEQKLREVEELRLAAERRAAEAERLLHEQEALLTAAENEKKAAAISTKAPATVPEDDLLGLNEGVHTSSQPNSFADDFELEMSIAPDRPEPEVMAFEAPATPEPEPERPAVPVVQQVPQVQEKLEPVVEKVTVSEPVTLEYSEPPVHEVPQVETEPVTFAAAETPEESFEETEENVSETVAPAAFDEAEDVYVEPAAEPETAVSIPAPVAVPEEFAAAAAAGMKLPIPLIAGAALLLVLAVAGYFLLGGSSTAVEPPVTTQSAPPPAAEPQPAEAEPAVQQNSFATEPAAETPSDPIQAEEVQPDRSAKSAKTQPAKTVKPAKSPEKKKAVTVDDLINDN